MKESQYLEGQDSVVKKIKNLPIFKPYDEEKLKDLLRLSKIRQYEPEEIIIEEGTDEIWMYFMLSGCVQVEKGGKYVDRLKRCGDIFGEMGFLGQGPRSATVKALEETVCLAVDVSYLLKMKEEGYDSFHAAIYKMFSEILAHRLRETTDKYLKVKQELDRLKGTGKYIVR